MVYMYILGVLVVCLIAFLLALYFTLSLYSFAKGSPYVPTSISQIDEILEYARLTNGQNFIELGSGDGRITIRAAQKYGVNATGIEINPALIALSRIIARTKHLSTVTFKREDLFTTDISNADVIFLFLLPQTIKKLSDRLRTDLKDGALVVSHGFVVPTFDKHLIHTLNRKPFSTYYYRLSTINYAKKTQSHTIV